MVKEISPDDMIERMRVTAVLRENPNGSFSLPYETQDFREALHRFFHEISFNKDKILSITIDRDPPFRRGDFPDYDEEHKA